MRGKSDGPVVPEKLSNNAQGGAAEAVEERGPAEENADSATRPGHRAGLSVSSGLDRVRQAARRDKDVRFTALLHHVDVDRLRVAYRALNPKAATGVDGVSVGGVRAGPGGQPSGSARSSSQGRVPGEAVSQGVHPQGGRETAAHRYSRAGGQDRPAGAVAVLNAVYETDFLGFSYGFRPGRSATWRWMPWRSESRQRR